MFQLIDSIAVKHYGVGYDGAFDFGDEAKLREVLTAAKFMAIAIETAQRKVRFPEPERFVRLSLESIARQRDAEATKIPVAIDEAMVAIEPHLVDGALEMMTSTLIAVGRVSAKT